MQSVSYPKEVIRDLIEGRLPWVQTKSIISGYKDDDRFDKYIEVLQEKVPWDDRILLPLSFHLYIVQQDTKRIVKCTCGYEFGDYRQNWKLSALMYIRSEQDELEELYPYPSEIDPEYCEIREYCCPGCGTQLEVEVVPFGYPAVFDFLPDLDTFYSEWLGRPLPDKLEFKDTTYDLIEKWAQEI